MHTTPASQNGSAGFRRQGAGKRRAAQHKQNPHRRPRERSASNTQFGKRQACLFDVLVHDRKEAVRRRFAIDLKLRQPNDKPKSGIKPRNAAKTARGNHKGEDGEGDALS